GAGRFVLGFTTHALFTTTPAGAYQLTISALARPTLAQPHPIPVTRIVTLPSIAALRVGEDPFTDPAPIPVRHQRDQILIYLRASVAVSLTLASPDGRSVHASVGAP